MNSICLAFFTRLIKIKRNVCLKSLSLHSLTLPIKNTNVSNELQRIKRLVDESLNESRISAFRNDFQFFSNGSSYDPVSLLPFLPS